MFKDKELAAKLERDGFGVIQLFEGEELEKLRKFYHDMHKDAAPHGLEEGIHMTTWCADMEYKMAIKQGLESIFKPACNGNFEDFRSFNHVFIIKRQGPDTAFLIHQDWNVVDEENDRSYNVWVPLYDLTEDNGAMWIVKGSHRLKNKVRGAGVIYPNFTPLFDDLKPYMTPVPMKGGQALIFSHNTLHGSPPNVLAQDRIVAACSIVPTEARVRIHFQKDRNSPLEIHYPEDNFMFYYNDLKRESQTRRPTASGYEEVPGYKFKDISIEEVMQVIS